MDNNISDEEREAIAAIEQKAAEIKAEIDRAMGSFNPDDTTPEPMRPIFDVGAWDSFTWESEQ